MFGFIVGCILTLLTFFQLTFATFLWPFLVPRIVIDNRKSRFQFIMTKSDPNKFLYGGWIFLVLGLLTLTIINVFTGSYSSLTYKIIELANGDYKNIIFYVVIAIVSGNILRIITMKLLTK